MDITAAQQDVRRVYRGGFAGPLVSAVVWTAASAVAQWWSVSAAMAVLFFGGVLLCPLSSRVLRAMRGPALLPKGHPSNALATQVALTVPLGLLVAIALGSVAPSLFLPASLVIVGAHYLMFISLYGMRVYAVLASALVGIGGLALFAVPSLRDASGWIGATVLLVSAVLVYRAHRAESSTPRPGENEDMNSPSTPRRPDVTEVDIIGGPERLEVELQEYDARWPETFLAHRERIREALGSTAVGIEHIGSTAVPGLAAKPIVDILVTVDDITAEEDYLEPLLAAGYVLRVREPRHRLVRTPSRDAHVHVYAHDDPAVEDYLLLRDRLRTHPTDRALYEQTKRALLERRWDDMNDYADAKTDVIVGIRTRARIAARANARDADPAAARDLP